MKTLISILVISIITLTSVKAQDSHTENEVKSILTKIIKLSESKKDKKLASYIIYAGADTTRKRKEACNPKHKDELIEVSKIRKNINILLEESYEFRKFTSKIHPSNASKSIYVWEVETKSKTVVFAFRKLKDKYVLVDID